MKRLFSQLLIAVALILAAAPTFAGALTDYGENKMLDCFARGQACGLPVTWYIAAYTDTCTDAGPGTEVSTSGTGYARVGVTASLANWAGSQGAGTTVASTGTSGTTSNNAAVTFGTPSGSWGQIQSIGWTDASTAGNRWVCLNLTNPKNVNNGDPAPNFPAGTLQFFIDN